MLSIGLVGLPNAGKSTLFNLITKRSIPAENFPFCTIEPNDGIVEVKDPRLEVLAKISGTNKIIPAAIEFKDIAGLVKNAHTGAGLGNQFLGHIKETDLILMVLRAFEDQNVIHVEDRVNPIEDFEILMLELTMADLKTVESAINRVKKELNKDKFAPDKLAILEGITLKLTNMKPASDYLTEDTLDKELPKWRKTLNLLTDKKILKLANIKTDGQNHEFDQDFELDILLEKELDGASSQERIEFGLKPQSGLDQIITECFKALDLETYLTTGVLETKAWTYTKGSLAPVCASKIHTDFEKKFIKAEIVKYQDFVDCNGTKLAIEQGKLKVVGKDYIMQDGDVVEFKIGT
jgi:ribosome-binding ATPase